MIELLSTKYSIERFIDDSQKVMEKNISGLCVQEGSIQYLEKNWSYFVGAVKNIIHTVLITYRNI